MNKHCFIKKLSYPNQFSDEYIYQIFKKQEILAFRNLFGVLKKILVKIHRYLNYWSS